MTGPLAGTKAQAGSRWLVVGKSPLAFPEQYACGNLGGRWGAALKWAGLDGLMIVGAADRPVILEINADGHVTLADASGLWGRDVPETMADPERTLRSRGRSSGDRQRRGEAGAVCLSNGGRRCCGRQGLRSGHGRQEPEGRSGAVLSGQCCRLRQPEAFRNVTRDITALWRGETSERYWIDAMLEGVEKVKTTPCFACPGICGRGLYTNSRGESGYGKNCASAYSYAYAEKALQRRHRRSILPGNPTGQPTRPVLQ